MEIELNQAFVHGAAGARGGACAQPSSTTPARRRCVADAPPSRASHESIASQESRMKIRIGYDMVYECPQPTPMILMLNIHYSRASDIVVPDHC